MKHCPTCNRPSDEVRFIGEFCEVCVAEKASRGMKEFATISQCRSCGRIRTPEGYAELDKKPLGDAIKHSLKLGPRYGLKVLEYDNLGAKVRFNYEVDDGERVTFERRVRFKKTHEMCTDCFRRRSGYFEAIVQLRGDKFLIGKMFERIRAYMDKHGAFVAKAEEHQFGVDVYLSDKSVANEFFKERDLKPERSYVLFGMKKGKRLFRNIYALKL